MNLTRKFQTLFFSAKDVQDYFVSFSARLIFGEFDIIWKNDADDVELWKYRQLFYVLSIDPFKVVSAGRSSADGNCSSGKTHFNNWNPWWIAADSIRWHQTVAGKYTTMLMAIY